MKVCFQTKTWGEGTGWFAQELALGIAEAGGEVIYVAPPAVPSEREPQHPALKRVVSHRELQSGSKFARFASSLRRVWDGYRACLMARVSTDRYLFSIPDPLPFFLPLQILLRIFGARQFSVVHDAIPHVWFNKVPPSLFHHRALKVSYQLATHLIATTNDCRKDLIAEFGINPARISVVPHGAFDLGAPSEAPGNANLLIFGSLRRNKRLLEAIQAVQICRSRGMNVSLTIAGAPDRGEPNYWAECEAQIALASEGISVELGFVPDERVPQLIAACDAALLPYRDFSSASGVAILLATSQRPVIATASGGIGDLFDMGMPGVRLAEGANSSVIADAIEVFISKPIEDRRREAVLARRTLLDCLSWKTIGGSYLDIIADRSRMRGAISEQSQ